MRQHTSYLRHAFCNNTQKSMSMSTLSNHEHNFSRARCFTSGVIFKLTVCSTYTNAAKSSE